MRTAIHTLTLVLVLAGCSPKEVAAPRMTPGAIEAEIQRHGAKQVVDRLWASEAWSQVEENIASGDRAWIVLAPQLKPGTDAGASEGLGAALSEALPKQPAAVLAMLDLKDGPVLGPSSICTPAFYDASDALVRDYLGRAIAAVAAVDDARLAPAKRACLAKLKASP